MKNTDRKQTLVIIPGVGDDLPVYDRFARRWSRLGYNVHVISFDWYEKTTRLAQKMAVFLAKLDDLQSPEVFLIGVSAGGTAAVNALAVRPYVRGIITVCAPLDTMPRLQNPLLAESIEEARQRLLLFTPAQKARVLSAYALHDPVVHRSLSMPKGIKTLLIPMVLHPAAIFVAMTIYARKLDSFLRHL